MAVTDSDELNMICCVIGKKLGAKHTVARVRNTDYSDEYKMLREELELDMVINPEMEAAAEIAQMIQYPFAADVETFANNLIELVEFRVLETDPIINKNLLELNNHLPSKVLFCSVMRKKVYTKGILYFTGRFSSGYEKEAASQFFKYLGRNSNKAKMLQL